MRSASDTVAKATETGSQMGLLHANGTASVKYSVVPLTIGLWSPTSEPPAPMMTKNRSSRSRNFVGATLPHGRRKMLRAANFGQ